MATQAAQTFDELRSDDGFDVQVRREGDAVVIAVSGELDLATVPRLRSVVDHLIEGQGDRLLDLNVSRLTFIDSTGIGLLVGTRRRLRENGGRLVITDPIAAIRRVLEMTGVDKLVDIRETVKSPSTSAAVDQERGRVDEVHRRAASGDPNAVAVLVDKYQGLARGLALRFAQRQDDRDDLVQVANYGLLKAIERFDVDRGFEFSTFAFSTILGELKRHRRNTSWAVHVPRAVQERSLAVADEVEQLCRVLGRYPTPSEVACSLQLSETDVVEVLDVRHLHRPASLDAPRPDAHGAATMAAPTDISTLEEGYDGVDRTELVNYLLARLSPREREIMQMRFLEGLHQSEIAAKVGISQMHVSRILRRAIERLRPLAE